MFSMSATTENGYFLLAGAALFLAAGVAVLLRDTRGVRLRFRISAILAKAWAGFVWTVPSRKWVKTLAAFLVGFLGGAALSGAICLALLEWSFSSEPRTGDERDAGLAILLLFMAGLALQVSITVGFISGMVVAARFHNRLSRAKPASGN
jgi:hypothetical protein